MRHGVRGVPVACDVATMEGVDALAEAANQSLANSFQSVDFPVATRSDFLSSNGPSWLKSYPSGNTRLALW